MDSQAIADQVCLDTLEVALVDLVVSQVIVGLVYRDTAGILVFQQLLVLV